MDEMMEMTEEMENKQDLVPVVEEKTQTLGEWWNSRPRIIKNPKTRKKVNAGIGIGILGLGIAGVIRHFTGAETEDILELTDQNPVDAPFDVVTETTEVIGQ